MQTVARFSTPAEAHVAQTRLMSAGIDAVVRDEFTVMFHWLWSNAIGGVKLEAPDHDAAAARQILALPPPEEGLLRCPYCDATEVSVRPLSAFGAVCVYFSLPIPMTRVVVDCRRCRRTYDVARNGKADRPAAPPP